MRGAIIVTRCADIEQVCVSHMSQMTIAVWATGQRSSFSDGLPDLSRLRARRLRIPGTFGRFAADFLAGPEGAPQGAGTGADPRV